MKQALILVDIQNDYFEGGRHELVSPEQAAIQAKKILTFFREQRWPIYHVRHISTSPSASFFLPDTEGSEFYKDIYPLVGEQIIIKHKPDSFLGTNLKEKLDESDIDMLVICGMMTHMCIDTTVRAAVSHGYSVELIEDACATRDLIWNGNTVKAEQVQNSFMAALDGSFAKVLNADVWIKEQDIPYSCE